MKWSAVAGALVMAAMPLGAQSPAASPKPPTELNGGKITLHGCVRPGIDKNTVLMTDVIEVTDAGHSAMPAEAHGRKILFWLDRDEPLKAHVGHMVEVTGRSSGLEKSEIELKAGRQKDGGLVAEFEGPGRDVKAPNDIVGSAIGTAGRVAAGQNDVPTFLLKVKVDSVRAVNATCN
jgi:hypothetical protein